MRQDLTNTSSHTPRTQHDAQFEVGVIPPAERRCLNCQTIMQGPYCFQCGQHEKSSIRHFGVFVRDVIDDVFNLDSRVVRTIKPLLFSPGFLTKEYLSGRRMRYVPPLRLYVIASLMFFLIVGSVVPRDVFKIRFDIGPKDAEKIAQQLVEAQNAPELVALRKDEEFAKLFAQAEQHAQWSDEQRKAFAKSMQAYVRQSTDKELNKLIEGSVDDEEEPEQNNDNNDAAPSAGAADAELAQVDAVQALIQAPTPPSAPTEPKPKAKTDKGPFILFGGLTQADNPWLYSLQERANVRWRELKDHPDQIKDTVFRILPQSMFILLPLFALMLKLFYPFSNRLYSEHLVTAVHSHSFMFLMMGLLISASYATSHLADLHSSFEVIQSLSSWFIVAGWIWLPVYLFMMQYTVYAQGVFITMLKFIFVGCFYIGLLGLVVALDFLFSLIRN